ncbi:efflux RND transporter permease subunit, partial [Duncaniella freteri]
GLASSYVVGITLLPVLYHIFSKKTTVRKRVENESAGYLRLYDRGIDLCFRHKWVLMILTMLMIPICVLLFMFMRHERMPEIDSNETLVRIDWNENISLDENRRRVGLLKDSSAVMNSAYIGPQDFLLASDLDFSSAEAELYFLTDSSDSIAPLQERVSDRLHNQYPNATFSFSKTENIFEKIFSSDEADIEVRIHSAGGGKYDIGDLLSLHQSMSHSTGISMTPVPLREQIDIIIDRERLALYNVEYSEVQRVLRTAFKGNSVSTLRSYNEYIPIEIVGSEMSINDVLAGSFVRSRADRNGVSTDIPLRSLLTTESSRDLKTITAGSAGEYVPVGLNVAGHENEVMQKVREVAYDDGNYDVDFEGSFFSNAKMMNELTVILLVSVMLMYFILCAQFESFLQPLIVLLEIPVDTAFALLALMIFGQTLNLMSAIGIIVTCGIVVNDSILKLDAINELRKDGMPLVEAIHTAGRRRLRAIIMTSLTTIFAMLPVLFTSDMGSELQRPLAIAMIGSMVVGTLVSIFIIPLFYWSIYRKHESK